MAQDYNIELQRYNGSDFDRLLPVPAAHASTHEEGGLDPITVTTNMLKDGNVTNAKLSNGAVSTGKLAANAVTNAITVTIPSMQANTPVVVTATGVTTTNHVIVTPSPDSFVEYVEAQVRCTAQGTDSLTFISTDATTGQLTANVLIVKK